MKVSIVSLVALVAAVSAGTPGFHDNADMSSDVTSIQGKHMNVSPHSNRLNARDNSCGSVWYLTKCANFWCPCGFEMPMQPPKKSMFLKRRLIFFFIATTLTAVTTTVTMTAMLVAVAAVLPTATPNVAPATKKCVPLY
ncbi:hypothetical protein DM01DRAFT_126415 [Hesseltinella vesiculosa]|uniref:Uncharacterized protein n=1 Tax=Hesseltinella vesiculosa TaxID=101127 RepID=A0A1X2GEX3_9FUNG|nr:hypothetical protein DM01DRAFT_126415 [Hesseltinella vesiculosa]